MPAYHLPKFPSMTTARLKLRELSLDDQSSLYQLRNDDRVNQYIKRTPPASLQEIQDWIKKVKESIREKKILYWTITLIDQDQLIGTICLWNFSTDLTAAEIGYELSPPFQGHGYMSEAMSAVIELAFQALHFQELLAYTHYNNSKSIALLDKFQFVRDPNSSDKNNLDNRVYVRNLSRKQ